MFSDHELGTIVEDLAGIIDQLRALGRRLAASLPNRVFGSWCGGPFTNGYFGPRDDDKPSTVFTSIDEFHAYFVARLEDILQRRPEFRETYDNLLTIRERSKEHPPVLSHGDLAPQNLIVKNGRIVAVIDWETFGWYPDFWEEFGVLSKPLTRRFIDAFEKKFGEESDESIVYDYVYSSLFPPY